MKRLCQRIVAVTIVLWMTSCMPAQLFSPIPLRNADLYPNSQTKAGIAVAVDQLTHPDRVRQYFGADLIKAEVLPVSIILSNNGKNRFVIKPADVLFLYGREVIDPVPVKTVEAAVYREHGPVSEETVHKVSDYFGTIAFQETVVGPRDNYQGVLFLRTGKNRNGIRAQEGAFSIAKLLDENSLNVRIAVTDMETQERILFGPFPLSGM